MAITFVASSGASLSANNNTTDVSLPSGIQEGDVIILEAASDGDFVGQDRIDPVDTLDAGSQGWFLLDVNDGSQGALCDGVTMAYVVPASPPTTVRLRAGDNDVAARLYAYRGVDPRVLDAWLGPDGGITGSSASPNPPSITTNTNGALVHASFHMDDDDTTVNSYSSGYTNGSSQNTGQSSNSIGATVGAASKIVATAGTESPAAISTNGNDAWIARSFALLPDQGEVENWAVQFLGASYGELDASTTGNSVSLPSGLQEDDVVYVFCSADDMFVGSSPTSPNNSSGWTEIAGDGTIVDHWIFRKVMGATPDTTISLDGPSSLYQAVVLCLAFRNVDTSSPEDVSYARSIDNTAPTVTTVTDNALVLRGIFTENQAEMWCIEPGYLHLGSNKADAWGDASNEAALSIFAQQQDTAGATGTQQLYSIKSTGTVPAISFTLALRPAEFTVTGAITLGGVTVSGSGTVAGSATGALTLPAAQVSGTGAIARDATGAITLPALTVSGAAEREIPGTGAIDLGSLLLAGSGTAGAAPITGAGAVTLGAIVAAGMAERSVTASGAITLAALTMSGAGTIARDATGAITLPAAVISGLAERVIPGSGAITLPAAEVAGQATREITGTGSMTLAGVIVSGAGNVTGGTITGTGALTLPAALIASIAERSIAGTGALALPTLTLAGAAERALTGVGDITLPAVDAAGAAERTITAAGTVTLPVTVIAGTAKQAITGTGALTIPAALLSGSEFLGEFITGRVVYAGASVTTSTLGESGNSSTIVSDGPNQTADEE